jgi:hypothetical protein
MSYTRLIKKI